MAKASSDRNTIDLFGQTRGRPKTHPLSRKDQLKLNKRLQREKDKAAGFKRLEIVLDDETIQKLDALCDLNELKRAEWLTMQVALAYSKSKFKKEIPSSEKKQKVTKK
ncbi:LexA regulated protein [Marinomonas balearica]|uniref:LexA regulated protein n=1 Tax=Marinomonas balearica TaxID=491947 RepID=A0A4R6MBC7_9GAMM|nr:LexA regulated protein [Marinomonas balearica]TDO98793.1 hypothetical protein DFP79_1206 [Marinomonas balearica]